MTIRQMLRWLLGALCWFAVVAGMVAFVFYSFMVLLIVLLAVTR